MSIVVVTCGRYTGATMLATAMLLCAVGLATSVPVQDEATPRFGESCGYESCTQAEEGVLNVHIVPHTHDDVGWLKTLDQYYYGSRNNIQKAGVQYILDSVVKELWDDPKRRFMYVETAFFWKWWVAQPDDIQSKVHTLVRQGRLQFAGGAWSMNDEASVHYQSTVDQFTWGLSKLSQTFGACGVPRVAWQIDPFGHSREFASLVAQMGYDGLFLGRIDYQDRINRRNEKTMETLWRGDDDLGKSTDLFTGVLYNHYSPPPGFCFDVLCNDEPIVDDVDSPQYNVDERIGEFLTFVTEQAKHFLTPNAILTMGGDFTYQDAHMWYKNLDKLIQHTNIKAAKEGLKVKLFYSTPDCYLKAVKDANPTLPIKQDDFFPYASDPNAYWTGYFSSRPTTKYFEREGNSYLQMVKQLQVLAGLEDHNIFVLNELKSAMGVMQHHDAITGTEKEHVTHDYERILTEAIEDALIIARQAFNKLMQGDALKAPIFTYDRCRLNESRCDTSENSQQFVVTVYNHLAWQINDSIRIPVVDGNYEVYAPNGEKIVSQIVDIPNPVRQIPTRESKATHEVVFIAYLHPLSFKSYYIRKVAARAKRDTKDSKYEYYNSINDYWKTRKEQPYVDIEDIETGQMYIAPNVNVKSYHYTDEPRDSVNEKGVPILEHVYTESYYADSIDENRYVNVPRDIDLDMLKDKNEGVLSVDIKQLEKIIRDARKSADALKRENIDRKVQFPSLNDEEMRMLSDDPMMVTIYPEDMFLENQHIKLRVDKSTGDLTYVTLQDGREVKLDIKFFYYPGCIGNNEIFVNRSSGAYIFRPNATSPIALGYNFTEGPSGPVVKEIRIATNDNVSAFVRLYDGLNFIENDWVVGPINIDDDIGKEYIVKYVTDIVNNGEFFTDSNGRQMLKRKLDKRPQYNVTIVEPVAGNYYPVTNKIYIEDDKAKLAVFTDRSEGGSSLQEGELELMLHRRLLHDDAFGVGEALNETAKGVGLVVRGRHRIFITRADNKDDYIEEKKQVLQYHLQPQVFVSDAKEVSLEKWMELTKAYSWANALPDGIHLLTLEPWNGNTLLLRLENYLERADKADTTIEVELNSIFKTLKLISFRETTLAANQWLDEKVKWVWNTDAEFTESFNKEFGSADTVESAKETEEAVDDGFKVKLKAKQIRTFVVQYQMN